MACNGYEWVDKSYIDDWTGEWVDEKVYSPIRCKTVDISLHSYKCTVCGEIGYYSARGKIAEKTGKTIWEITEKEMNE